MAERGRKRRGVSDNISCGCNESVEGKIQGRKLLFAAFHFHIASKYLVQIKGKVSFLDEIHEMGTPWCKGSEYLPFRLNMLLVVLALIQGDYVGFNTGNGEKLSYSQAAGLACSAWL